MRPFEDVYTLDSVTINVTNNCNLNCSYCFEHDKTDDYMSEETICSIIDKAYRKLDDDRIFMINIFGGEPMLNWQAIKAAVLHCDKKHYVVRFGITTNLTILTDEMLDMIDEYGIALLVSFDGTEYAHNINRCNSYSTTRDNLLRLKARGLERLVEVRMTVTPNNVIDLYDGVKDIINMGFDQVCPCLCTDQEWGPMELDLLGRSYRKIVTLYFMYMDDMNCKRNISIKLVDDYLYANLEPFTSDNRRCAIGTDRWCSIGTNGEVLPCHQWHTDKELREMSFGNVFTGVDETKLGEPPVFNPTEECLGCCAMSMCKGGCQSQNFMTSGSFDKPTKAYCDTCRMLAEITKDYQPMVLDAKNTRSRRLVQLKENLKVKKYFDEVLLKTPLDSPDFPIRLRTFQDMSNKLGDLMLGAFYDYFVLKLYPIAYLMGGVTVG